MTITLNWIAWTILFCVLADYLLNLITDRLNIGAIREDIPESFRHVYDAERYRQSQRYLRTNTRFGQIVATVDLLVLLVFWFSGGFASIDHWTRALDWRPIPTGMLYIGILAGLKAIVDLPFSLYATFVIETRFGFNRTTWSTWITDRLKGLLLAVGLGVPLLSGVLAFFHYTGTTAWLWCWALITLFTIIIQFVAPTWIMPLFNRFESLAPGELKDAIMAYAASIGFALDDIYVMDGSKRSSKSNAFFTGFGRHRRIVLFDTLIDNHSTQELVAILAHEMGHFRLRHILKMMVIGVVQSGVLLYLMSLMIRTPDLFAAFGIAQPSVHAGLIFFGLLYTPVAFFLGLIVQAISRRHEYAADRFAALSTGRVAPMVDALKKLSVHNLSNLSPHPVYVLLKYSHPPVMQRIEALLVGRQKSEDGNLKSGARCQKS